RQPSDRVVGKGEREEDAGEGGETAVYPDPQRSEGEGSPERPRGARFMRQAREVYGRCSRDSRMVTSLSQAQERNSSVGAPEIPPLHCVQGRDKLQNLLLVEQRIERLARVLGRLIPPRFVGGEVS